MIKGLSKKSFNPLLIYSFQYDPGGTDYFAI
jgi:hypothetical protein